MGKKYVANAFHNRSLIDKNKGGGGGSASVDIVEEETKIGTFLGEDLYRQVIKVSEMNTSTLEIDVNVYNVVNIYGTYVTTNGISDKRCVLNTYYTSTGSSSYFSGDPLTISAFVNGGKVNLKATNGYTSNTELKDFIIFVEYTK